MATLGFQVREDRDAGRWIAIQLYGNDGTKFQGSFPATLMAAGQSDCWISLDGSCRVCATTRPCSVQRENRRSELSNLASKTSIPERISATLQKPPHSTRR